jgi:hypothetical protein
MTNYAAFWYGSHELVDLTVAFWEWWSGREDSNFRPQRPERCALTRLRYAPLEN